MKVKRQSRKAVNKTRREKKPFDYLSLNNNVVTESEKEEKRKDQIRQAKQKLRSKSTYKNEENLKNRMRNRQIYRDNIDGKKIKHVEYTRKRMQRKRLNDDFRKKENAKELNRKKRKREHDDYRNKENEKNLIRIKRKREFPDFKQLENRKTLSRMKILRQRINYIAKEIAKNSARNKILRHNDAYKSRELAKNSARNIILRHNDAYKSRELAANIARNKMLRRNLVYTKNELQQNINHMRLMRKHKKYKCKERLNNVQRIRKLRQSLRYKYRESLKISVFRQEMRDIDVLRCRDNLYIYLLNQKDDNTTAKLKWQFIKFRMETPSFICCCCEGLFLKSAVVKLNELRIDKAGDAILSQINNFPSGFICGTCKSYAYRGKVYKLSTSNGLKFPTVPKSVKELTDLEERMVAPILNFMQIRALKPYALNPQLGLKGSVVNIQIDVNNMLEVLPRKFTEMETIQLKLKRHTDHRSDYMFESVRPGVICKALQHLVKTPLYVKYAIKVDEKYLQNYASHGSEEINFIVDNNDEVDENKEKMLDNMDLVNNNAICLDQINNDEVLLVDNNAAVTEGHSSVVNIIAPGQGKYPLPWHKMDDLDELCFPRIFAGFLSICRNQ